MLRVTARFLPLVIATAAVAAGRLHPRERRPRRRSGDARRLRVRRCARGTCEVWACFDTANAAFWNEAATAGRAYMQKVVDSNGVCPYQASFTATNPQAANADSTRCVVNLMMDWYLFGKDPWQRDTYAPRFAAYSSSRNNGGAAVGCNSTLGFGLPASSGKAFVDKLWSTGVPSRAYWNGVLYMLGMLHVSGNFRVW